MPPIDPQLSAEASAAGPLPFIVTSWTTVPDDPLTDDERIVQDVRDLLFRQRVMQVLREQAPWLEPILEAAGATIVAGRGSFFVMLGGDPNRHVEIPGLGAHLLLLPWAEPDELKN